MPAPTQQHVVRSSYISFLLLLLILLIIELQLAVMQKKISEISMRQPDERVQQYPVDMSGTENLFQKRTIAFTKSNVISREVQGVDDQQLIGLRCTQVIANDGAGTFWWRSPFSHDMYDKVDDEVMVRALEEANMSQPSGKAIISARFCESEYGNVLMHYVTGKKGDHGNKGYYDGKDADAYITVLDEQAKYTPGVHIMHENVWPYALCNAPLQMTTEGKVYMLCGVVHGNTATNYLHIVDLVTKTSTLRVSCTYDHEDNKLGESCSMNAML